MSYTARFDWDRCTLCGDCLVRCPAMSLDRETARVEIKSLIAGEYAKNVFSKCTLCFDCNRYCPENLHPHELILQRITENRKKPISAMVPYLMNGLEGHTLFPDLYDKLEAEEKDILEKWSQVPEESDEILWIGCVGRLSCKDLENSKVLASLPKFSPPDLCCGELQYRMGGWDVYADRIEKTLERFSALKTKRMVCYCASCYNFFSNILPNVHGKKLPFEVISLYQWMWEKVEANELKVQKPLDYEAAITESCYVSELEPEFAENLRNLYKEAGLKTVELEHRGEDNLSCGACSFARDQNIFKSMLRVQRKKYQEIKKTGVKQAALNCPGCFITMGFTNKLYGVKLRYMPDELLGAFGDEITKPIGKRLPLIVTTVARRANLLFKKVDPDLSKLTIQA